VETTDATVAPEHGKKGWQLHTNAMHDKKRHRLSPYCTTLYSRLFYYHCLLQTCISGESFIDYFATCEGNVCVTFNFCWRSMLGCYRCTMWRNFGNTASYHTTNPQVTTALKITANLKIVITAKQEHTYNRYYFMLHFPQYVSFSLSHHQGGKILWNIHNTVYECAITLVSTTHESFMCNIQQYKKQFHQLNINHSTCIKRNTLIIKN
jgi:hypothetical protein